MQSEYELFSHWSLAIFGLPFYLGGAGGGGGGLTNNHLITFSYHIPIPTPLFGDTCLTVAVKGTGTVSSQIAFLVAIVERFVLFVYGLCVFAVSAFPKSGDWDTGVLVHFSAKCPSCPHKYHLRLSFPGQRLSDLGVFFRRLART